MAEEGLDAEEQVNTQSNDMTLDEDCNGLRMDLRVMFQGKQLSSYIC